MSTHSDLEVYLDRLLHDASTMALLLCRAFSSFLFGVRPALSSKKCFVDKDGKQRWSE